MQVDRGAVPFIMRASPIMCPGFTSAGGSIPDEKIPKDMPVVCVYVASAD
jgi:predicted ribosome-associated RNA-binding protein Tma20